MKKEIVPGSSVEIVDRNGRVVKRRGYGIANLDYGNRATPDTSYEWASVSKPVVSVAIMQLVEAGKLKLDAPIGELFPEYPEKWRPVTTRQLLTHTSGMVELGWDITKLSAAMPLRYTAKATVEDAGRQPLRFAPGTGFQYSNTGMWVLGQIVAKVSGQPVRKYIQENIFDRAKMRTARFVDPSETVPNRAEQYTNRDGKPAVFRLGNLLQVIDDNTFGGMRGTTDDLRRFLDACTDGTLIKPQTWREMVTPQRYANGAVIALDKDRMGLGFFLVQIQGQTWAQHSGFTGTVMLRRVTDNATVILLTNLGNGYPPPFARDRGFNISALGVSVVELAFPVRRN